MKPFIQFHYEPPKSEQYEEEAKTSSKVSLTVKCNGVTLTLQDGWKYSLGNIDLVTNKTYLSHVTKRDGRYRVSIGAWGEFSDPWLQEIKDQLPDLFRLFGNSIPLPKPKLDLNRGPIKQTVEIEYSFTDQEVKKVEKTRDIPGHVFFNCSVYPREEIQVKCSHGKLIFRPTHVSRLEGGNWVFGYLGFVKLPQGLNWTPEEIKSAFQDLGCKIVGLGPMDVQTWFPKEKTTISLE